MSQLDFFLCLGSLDCLTDPESKPHNQSSKRSKLGVLTAVCKNSMLGIGFWQTDQCAQGSFEIVGTRQDSKIGFTEWVVDNPPFGIFHS